MGMDATATLFYGFPITGRLVGDKPGNEEIEGLEERAYDYQYDKRDKECPPPFEDYDAKRGKEDEAYEELWRDWRVRANAWWKQQCGLGWSGSSFEVFGYVYVVASECTASNEEMKEISTLDVGEDWYEKLKVYCEALGVPWQQPRWYLTSYYG